MYPHYTHSLIHTFIHAYINTYRLALTLNTPHWNDWPRSGALGIRSKPKESQDCYFEILGKLDELGGTSVIKGCKTNAKGMVVQGRPRTCVGDVCMCVNAERTRKMEKDLHKKERDRYIDT